MMTILGWLISGLIIGAIARLLMPGRQPMGMIMTIVLGIVGAVIGGGLSYLMFGEPSEDPFHQNSLISYVLSVLGAMFVLMIGGAMTRSNRTTY